MPPKKKKSRSTTTPSGLAHIGLPSFMPHNEAAMGVVGTKLLLYRIKVTPTEERAIIEHGNVINTDSSMPSLVKFTCATRAKAKKLLQDILDGEVKDRKGKPVVDSAAFNSVNLEMD